LNVTLIAEWSRHQPEACDLTHFEVAIISVGALIFAIASVANAGLVLKAGCAIFKVAIKLADRNM
jgi:hypothetical protein